ncbi:hypothetical protein [Desulfosediminicola ganghwensis]|uniref:hypothetical protein n=1 Tax=Desulfosediminicola ganghwensis TaxID=2569540 RepID=UPI0010AD17CA|nr:hypothetical protein [Desulfosediminicola ganghwensis]
MLFKINEIGTGDHTLSSVESKTLFSIGLKEKDLENIIYKNINHVIRSADLITIGHSRNWQEEPDILALDEEGNLYIFELKAWESNKNNLLQVMRYAQMFSTYDYDRLNRLWKKFGSGDLEEAHKDYFGVKTSINRKRFNNKQVLIVMTNGLDVETRVAIKYWHGLGIDIRPWVYKVYEIEGQKYISFEAFGSTVDPYEDVVSSYHLVNTCKAHGNKFHDNMISKERASAYNNPWKLSIMNIKKGDIVFLYESRKGIIAYGTSNSQYKIGDWDGDEEYFVELDNFNRVKPAIRAGKLREIADYHVPLLRTYTSLRKKSGDDLINHIKSKE